MDTQWIGAKGVCIKVERTRSYTTYQGVNVSGYPSEYSGKQACNMVRISFLKPHSFCGEWIRKGKWRCRSQLEYFVVVQGKDEFWGSGSDKDCQLDLKDFGERLLIWGGRKGWRKAVIKADSLVPELSLPWSDYFEEEAWVRLGNPKFGCLLVSLRMFLSSSLHGCHLLTATSLWVGTMSSHPAVVGLMGHRHCSPAAGRQH